MWNYAAACPLPICQLPEGRQAPFGLHCLPGFGLAQDLSSCLGVELVGAASRFIFWWRYN